MINLKFIEIDTNPIKPKATVHASGRLGFNVEAIDFMELSNKKFFRVAVADDNGTALKNIYLIEQDNSEGAAKVSKAGDYYYLNVGNLFEDLEIDYKDYTIIYDIRKQLYEERDMYVLKMRKPKRKKKNDDIEITQ
jgi:hypothetical protein